MKKITYTRPTTPVKEDPKPAVQEAKTVAELILLAGLRIP